jgi:ATP phosphoribosyltransferase
MLARRFQLRFALPNGRFLKQSKDLLSSLDGDVATVNTDRVSLFDGDAVAYLLKARDIPHLIATQRVHIGLVPEEWFMEFNSRGQGNRLKVVERTSWINTSLVFFSMSENDWPPKETARIATPFPSLAERTLKKQNVQCTEILPLSGSTEAVLPDIADIGFDCVETGDTLKRHKMVQLFVAYENLSVSLAMSTLTSTASTSSLISHITKHLQARNPISFGTSQKP